MVSEVFVWVGGFVLRTAIPWNNEECQFKRLKQDARGIAIRSTSLVGSITSALDHFKMLESMWFLVDFDVLTEQVEHEMSRAW